MTTIVEQQQQQQHCRRSSSNNINKTKMTNGGAATATSSSSWRGIWMIGFVLFISTVSLFHESKSIRQIHQQQKAKIAIIDHHHDTAAAAAGSSSLLLPHQAATKEQQGSGPEEEEESKVKMIMTTTTTSAVAATTNTTTTSTSTTTTVEQKEGTEAIAVAATDNETTVPPRTATTNTTGNSLAMDATSNPRLLSLSDEWLTSCAADLAIVSNASGPFEVLANNAIGDCIKVCQCFSKPKWTMNYQYKDRACTPKSRRDVGNLTLVNEIHRMQESKWPQDFKRPDDDTLVIHLRLGDVIEQASQTVPNLLTKGGNPAHVKEYANSLKSAYEYIENIRESGMTKVSIVGGSHRPHFYQKSRVYAGCLYKAIEQAGYNVTMRIEGSHPDYDFFYMSHAKQIVVSAGGYSNLIGLLVEQRGGQVIGRKFQSQFLGLEYFKQQKNEQQQAVAAEAVVETRAKATEPEAAVQTTTTTNTKGNSLATTTTNSLSLSDEWLTSCAADLAIASNASGPFEVLANNAIGDCIKICQCYSKPKWTMNFQYKNRACTPKSRRDVANLTLVNEIHHMQETKWPQDFKRPDDDTLVIHLRLGDVIEKAPQTVPSLLIKGGNPAHVKEYAKSLKSAYEYIENIRESGMTKVSIVGGSHKPQFYQKSRVYAGCLYRAIEQAGYDVTMRIEGSHPDYDFFYMSHAKQIVVSAGGYSNLIGLLVEQRGGRVIGRKFQSQFLKLPYFKSPVGEGAVASNATK